MPRFHCCCPITASLRAQTSMVLVSHMTRRARPWLPSETLAKPNFVVSRKWSRIMKSTWGMMTLWTRFPTTPTSTIAIKSYSRQPIWLCTRSCSHAAPSPTAVSGRRRVTACSNQEEAANSRPLNATNVAQEEEQPKPLPDMVLAGLDANPLISRDFFAGFVAPDASIVARADVAVLNMQF
ncbi:hypothetical protein BCR44DRAFT_75063 [Catenaria anguillulae PL171]|uniref:Uncharacterized protein n=1 Tax=Catenaria anguillulae PL171 TaxID=765915 RepID=A0A1Y2H9B0_9FUNG|nr:hypothetical protein BCR44DRAFT_75063 [Catenaria anguillulae PL171]